MQLCKIDTFKDKIYTQGLQSALHSVLKIYRGSIILKNAKYENYVIFEQSNRNRYVCVCVCARAHALHRIALVSTFASCFKCPFDEFDRFPLSLKGLESCFLKQFFSFECWSGSRGA